MLSTFFGLELGRRALSAFRRAIDVVGHNVANVNTPGFHRQSPVMSASDPFAAPSFVKEIGPYQVGTGVDVISIYRNYDKALEYNIRNLVSTQGNYSMSAQFLQQIDSIAGLREGIFDKITDFFNAFQSVSNTPESITVRQVAVQAGVSLSQEINALSQTLMNARNDTDRYIQQDITKVNTLLQHLRDLNVLIREASGTGDMPNDLLDQRDQALNDLSNYVDITVSEGTNNSIQVYIGGRVVVQDNYYLTLVGVQDPANYNYVDIRFSDAPLGPDATINDGELRGLLNLRDSASTGILYYKQQLDNFATEFINTINTQHALGFDLAGAAGGNFFDPVVPAEPALNMQVNAAFLNPITGPGLLAAASNAAGVPGDGLNALAIAQIVDAGIAGLGGYTFSDFFTQLVSHLGANTADTETRMNYTQNLLTEVQNLRDSASAVSLDEEGTYLLEYEKSYQAAAKIITAYDEMLEIIINLVG